MHKPPSLCFLAIVLVGLAFLPMRCPATMAPVASREAASVSDGSAVGLVLSGMPAGNVSASAFAEVVFSLCGPWFVGQRRRRRDFAPG